MKKILDLVTSTKRKDNIVEDLTISANEKVGLERKLISLVTEEVMMESLIKPLHGDSSLVLHWIHHVGNILELLIERFSVSYDEEEPLHGLLIQTSTVLVKDILSKHVHNDILIVQGLELLNHITAVLQFSITKKELEYVNVNDTPVVGQARVEMVENEHYPLEESHVIAFRNWSITIMEFIQEQLLLTKSEMTFSQMIHHSCVIINQINRSLGTIVDKEWLYVLEACHEHLIDTVVNYVQPNNKVATTDAISNIKNDDEKLVLTMCQTITAFTVAIQRSSRYYNQQDMLNATLKGFYAVLRWCCCCSKEEKMSLRRLDVLVYVFQSLMTIFPIESQEYDQDENDFTYSTALTESFKNDILMVIFQPLRDYVTFLTHSTHASSMLAATTSSTSGSVLLDTVSQHKVTNMIQVLFDLLHQFYYVLESDEDDPSSNKQSDGFIHHLVYRCGKLLDSLPAIESPMHRQRDAADAIVTLIDLLQILSTDTTNNIFLIESVVVFIFRLLAFSKPLRAHFAKIILAESSVSILELLRNIMQCEYENSLPLTAAICHIFATMMIRPEGNIRQQVTAKLLAIDPMIETSIWNVVKFYATLTFDSLANLHVRPLYSGISFRAILFCSVGWLFEAFYNYHQGQQQTGEATETSDTPSDSTPDYKAQCEVIIQVIYHHHEYDLCILQAMMTVLFCYLGTVSQYHKVYTSSVIEEDNRSTPVKTATPLAYDEAGRSDDDDDVSTYDEEEDDDEAEVIQQDSNVISEVDNDSKLAPNPILLQNRCCQAVSETITMLLTKPVIDCNDETGFQILTKIASDNITNWFLDIIPLLRKSVFGNVPASWSAHQFVLRNVEVVKKLLQLILKGLEYCDTRCEHRTIPDFLQELRDQSHQMRKHLIECLHLLLIDEGTQSEYATLVMESIPQVCTILVGQLQCGCYEVDRKYALTIVQTLHILTKYHSKAVLENIKAKMPSLEKFWFHCKKLYAYEKETCFCLELLQFLVHITAHSEDNVDSTTTEPIITFHQRLLVGDPRRCVYNTSWKGGAIIKTIFRSYHQRAARNVQPSVTTKQLLTKACEFLYNCLVALVDIYDTFEGTLILTYLDFGLFNGDIPGLVDDFLKVLSNHTLLDEVMMVNTILKSFYLLLCRTVQEEPESQIWKLENIEITPDLHSTLHDLRNYLVAHSNDHSDKTSAISQDQQHTLSLVEDLLRLLRQHRKHSFYDYLDSIDEVRDAIPAEYICPITLKIMEDPVLLTDGHSYDRTAITKWFLTNRRSPKTNQELADKSTFPNRALQTLIVSFVEAKHKEYLQQDEQPSKRRRGN